MAGEMPGSSGRLGADPAPESGEHFAVIATMGGLTIEEITSSADPDTARQVQDHDEWVVLLTGRAELQIDGSTRELHAGDWLLLPAGTPHRVLRTEPGSRWLAVHAPPSVDGG
jgi:quercetin dioxygenase-like cupin family protein